MEMHVLLADRRDEMAGRRERTQVAGVIIDPRRNPCARIAEAADLFQERAVFLVVPGSAAHAGPGEIDKMDRRVRRHLRPAAGAAGIAETPIVISRGML